MKECKNCSKSLNKDDFWPNRKICKVCYYNKYCRQTCKDCGFVYTKSAGACRMCRYKDGKFCNCCKTKLPIENFSIGTKNSKYRANCKKCEVQKSKEYKQKKSRKG